MRRFKFVENLTSLKSWYSDLLNNHFSIVKLTWQFLIIITLSDPIIIEALDWYDNGSFMTIYNGQNFKLILFLFISLNC